MQEDEVKVYLCSCWLRTADLKSDLAEADLRDRHSARSHNVPEHIVGGLHTGLEVERRQCRQQDPHLRRIRQVEHIRHMHKWAFVFISDDLRLLEILLVLTVFVKLFQYAAHSCK